MAEIADIAGRSRPSLSDGADKHARGAAAPRHPSGAGLTALTAIPLEQWRALAECAVEPNGYYLPAWELAVNASARGRASVSALGAWRDVSLSQDELSRLIGLLPVVSMWRACKIPLPALVSASPYGTLCTPLSIAPSRRKQPDA